MDYVSGGVLVRDRSPRADDVAVYGGVTPPGEPLGARVNGMAGRALPSVSVVVPTKNRPAEVTALLRSLRAQRTMAFEVIVIDQSTPAYVLEPFPELRHHHDPSLGGITGARNRGIDLATGDVILFFDDDAILETDCVAEIARTYADRPDVIGAQCLVLYPKSETPRLFSATERFFRHGFFNARPRRRRGEIIPRLIDGVASSYRRALFERERFDEALPGYGLAEDWDITKRAARHGALTLVPAARVRHEHSLKNRATLPTTRKQRRTNFLYLYEKHEAYRDPRNRLWKRWFLLGENLREWKDRLPGLARS